MAARLLSFTAVLISCLLVACGSRGVDTVDTRCVFPDSPRFPAPEFICQPDIIGFPLTELRSSPDSDASISERIEHVFNDQVNHWASHWSQQWYSGVGQRQQAQQFLQAFLAEKARVVRSRMSPNDHLWLLIGLPMGVEDVHAATELAVPQAAQ